MRFGTRIRSYEGLPICVVDSPEHTIRVREAFSASALGYVSSASKHGAGFRICVLSILDIRDRRHGVRLSQGGVMWQALWNEREGGA